jgi:pre-mycofactocin synthase
MGQELSLPVIISPAGVQSVHPDGEVAVARAAAARGTATGPSSFASKPVEAIVAANPKTFFQLYSAGSREQIAARIERAHAAGAVGMIVSLDWTFCDSRDWGSPRIPERMDLRTAVRMLPEALTRPQWFVAWTRAGGPHPAAVVRGLDTRRRASPGRSGSWPGRVPAARPT